MIIYIICTLLLILPFFIALAIGYITSLIMAHIVMLTWGPSGLIPLLLAHTLYAIGPFLIALISIIGVLYIRSKLNSQPYINEKSQVKNFNNWATAIIIIAVVIIQIVPVYKIMNITSKVKSLRHKIELLNNKRQQEPNSSFYYDRKLAEAYEDWIKIDARMVDYRALARIYRRLGELDKVIDCINKRQAIYGVYWEDNLELGRIYLEKDDINKALEYVDKLRESKFEKSASELEKEIAEILTKQ